MRRALTVLLSILVLFSSVVLLNCIAFGDEPTYTYTLIDKETGGIQINKYNGDEERVFVPEEIDGYRVVKINQHCFQYKPNIREIHIPKTVTQIVPESFFACIACENYFVDADNESYCSIDGVIYSKDGATLCFYPENHQQEIFTVPANVKKIEANAFAYYSISGVTSEPMLQHIHFSEGLEEIGRDAFYGARIKEYIFPDSLVKTDSTLFSGAVGYTKLHIGAGMKTNANTLVWHYDRHTLKEITVSPDNQYFTAEDNILFNKDKTVLYCVPAGLGIKTYRVPDSVRTIDYGAFYYTASLTEIDFNNVEVIQPRAFGGTLSIKQLTLPKSVKIAKDIAVFQPSLQSITVLNPECELELSFLSKSVTVYGFIGSTAEALVKNNKQSDVKLTFSALHTGETDSDPYSAAHQYVSTVIAPTCTECGYTHYQCSVCALEFDDNYTDALGHNYLPSSIIAPACTEQGYTIYQCSRCGDTRHSDYTAPTGHSFTVTEKVEPTCTESGYTKRKCILCGETDIKYFDAIGHNFSVYGKREPTCTTAGYTTYICSNCSYTYQADNAEPLGHHYVTKVTKAATTEEEGVLTNSCSVCGLVKSTAKIDKIKSISLSNVLFTYTGTALNGPEVIVLSSNGEDISADNYSVSYIDRSNSKAVTEISYIGQYKMEIVFKNNYYGIHYCYFSVIPKTPDIKNVIATDNSVTAVWEEDTAATGYEVLIAEDKSFEKGRKTYKITNDTPASKTIDGLKAGTAYYIKIRSYKTVTVEEKSTTMYSNYSDVKTVATSKASMKTGWLKKDGIWYYRSTNGTLATSWQKISGKWYYFNGEGKMQTGWVKVSGKWYYLNSSGTMATGWKNVSGKWYYLNPSGAMQTGWIKVSGKWYYLEKSGAMLADTSKIINGKTYRFNRDGICLNP